MVENFEEVSLEVCGTVTNINFYQEQVGGAKVRVLGVHEKTPKGHFEGRIISRTLGLELPDSMTTDPRGPEMFAETLIELAHRYDPFNNPRTKVGIVFESSEIPESVGLCYQPIDRIKAEHIVQSLALQSQSNKSVLELETPKINARFTYINPPVGSGKRRFDTGEILELTVFEKRRKSSELEIEMNEELPKVKQRRSNIMPNEVIEDCLVHALYQTLMYYNWKICRTQESQNKYRNALRKTFKRPHICQEVYEAVKAMKEKAGVSKSSNFCRMDVERFQNTVFAGTHQLIVFVKNSTIPFYSGPYVGDKKQLALYLDDGHYRGVRSICALLRTDYYCALCNRGYRNTVLHYKCPLVHRLCGQRHCPVTESDQPTRCKTCTVLFKSQTCYENHIKKGPKNGKSRCDYTTVCKKCEDVYYTNKGNRHKCGQKWCYRCNCQRITPHNCLMPISKKNEKKLTRRRVYFDIESRADESTGQQHPVLFVALRCCPECTTFIPNDIEQARNMVCSKCAPDGRLKVIECITIENRNVDVGSEMTKWLFADHHQGAVVVAHNASGYDGQFILENLIASNKASPKLVMDGTKLIFMEHNGVKLLDSIRYLSMSLSSLGKTFNVDSVKGDFPVLFIKPENYTYVGPLPEDCHYAMDNKSSAVKEQLSTFLSAQRDEGKIFNFVEEIFKYCYNDVYILATSMGLFETEFEKITNVCLLEESTTAASAAALVFRRNHLDSEKPIVLDVKPSVSMNASEVSQKYLAWFASKEDVQLNMSTTYGEEKIGRYRVDGFVHSCPKYPQGLIVEFFGCYWHAHECTYSEESMIGCESAKEIRLKDEKRLNALREFHPVKVVWECEVKKQLLRNPEMAAFFRDYEAVGLLHCDRALTGGRTEVFRLYANNEGKTLRYADVVSLYPTVMKHDPFPIGAPENVPKSSMEVPMKKPTDLTFCGFLSCKVLPPRHLKLPVLPIKDNGKLLFGLCKKCCRDSNQHDCEHSDNDRLFSGTFTTVELQKALSLGYQITEVFHVKTGIWGIHVILFLQGVKYENWVQNDESGRGGLFTSYINQMMEEKIYSTGWPANVITDAQKDAYCKAYFDKEQIHLTDYSRFSKNPGKRAVAKLMLNSLWGKFAQRVDRETTCIVTDPTVFWNIFYDTTIVISDVLCVNDALIIKYRKQAETLESFKTSAMQLAALTTSYARLRLYRFMEMVGAENIMYTGIFQSVVNFSHSKFTDTDSIIYAVPEGSNDPLRGEIGPYLGQLTDELDGAMTEFVTLGPKTYCYKEVSADESLKVVRKAKGITVNSVVKNLMSFDLMKNMVDEVLQDVYQRTRVQFPQHVMYRDAYHHVYSKKIFKKFQFTFNKRRIVSDGSTLPYGFCA
ncbi:hypothetical protein CRE_08364 [Caenorhabditis remanei]|uniref:DNA-directed DNA polymerase n=1 Tax=Caenorhabditis remanei TaxID=31234 RepID=E3MPN7_CAERE|nr:hypothetical protein CRE_08364 [Caenorhabditis remanei]